jgi:hypothetical protein
MDPLTGPDAEGGSEMLDGSDFTARLETVERRLDDHARSSTPAGLTEPDPGGTERWEAGQVWAHIAEFVPYWHAELKSVIAAYDGEPVPFGRVKTDPGRIAAIEMGRHDPVADSFERMREAIAGLRRYLDGLTSAEWNAVGRHEIRGDMDVEAIVERFVVAHLEEHAEQLDGLAAQG